ncbi:hypothetical protein ALC57_06619, partial [Trachymyrmex cornetzi]
RCQVIPACLLVLTEARRMQIRPRVTEPQVYYGEEDNQAAEDEFDTVAVYQPRTRALPSPRSKDALHGSKPPPVQTIRNYNKVNDDGSFTFGYEAADGSFKEETRGTDCVEEEELSGPANYPVVRPIPRPVSVRPTYHQPTTTRAPTTIFQTEYQLDDDASQELSEDDLKPQLRPSAFRRPSTLVQVTPSTAIYESSPSSSPSLFRLASTPAQYQTTATPVLRSQPTVTSSVYQSLETTTRRPVTRHPSVRAQSVAITPRPHVAQVAAQYVSPSSTERPDSLLYAQTHPTISPSRTTTAANAHHLDFAAELERYVNTVGSHVPAAPVARPQTAQASPQPTSRVKLTGQTSVTAASAAAEPIYQSELVYDPATGQYNTQLYQTLPQTVGDFSLSHKLQPVVPNASYYAMQRRIKGSISEALHIMTSMSQYQHLFSSLQMIKYRKFIFPFKMTPWLMAFFCLATASCSNVTDQQTSETQHDQVAILKQIRKVNEDGSYTYGYEAGDGSFKGNTSDVVTQTRLLFPVSIACAFQLCLRLPVRASYVENPLWSRRTGVYDVGRACRVGIVGLRDAVAQTWLCWQRAWSRPLIDSPGALKVGLDPRMLAILFLQVSTKLVLEVTIDYFPDDGAIPTQHAEEKHSANNKRQHYKILWLRLIIPVRYYNILRIVVCRYILNISCNYNMPTVC